MKRREFIKAPLLLGLGALISDVKAPMICVRTGQAVGDFHPGDMVVLDDPPQVVGICTKVTTKGFGSADLFFRGYE